jgi:CBS domain containing-hemolysin-like protein
MEECYLGSAKSKGKGKGSNKPYYRWILTIIFWTILISGSVTLMSDVLLRSVKILVAFIILIIIIGIGIFFDIIGVAVTAGDETPFHSMASKKLRGASIAISLIRHADKASSFCNDVIGDVCGIISGSAGAIITTKIVLSHSSYVDLLMTSAIGALIAAFTVAGKAAGKNYAIKNSNKIILWVARIIYFFKKDR